jgi:hypothetical protein
MKSKFFVESGFESTERIESMLRCSEITFNAVFDWFSQHEEMPRITNSVTSELLPKMDKEDPDLLTDVIAAIYTIVQSLYKYEDDFECYMVDFKQLHPDLFKEESYSRRLNLIGPLSKKYITFFKTASAQQAGAPVLSHASGSIALKPIISERFDYDSMKIESYKPKISGYSPVAMVELSRSGSDDTFSFQMRPREFDRFVNDLIALKIELSEVESKWRS